MHPQMVTGVEDIAGLFSVFHDGTIVDATMDGADLLLRVKIAYLAARIQPGLTTFAIRFSRVEDLTFETWPNEPASPPDIFRTVPDVFVPPLDILSGEVVAGRLEIACNQPSPGSDYCGGTLSFRTASALVTDQNGNSYTLSELRGLAEGYWKDWTERSSKA